MYRTNKLKKLRKNMGFTMKDMALKLHISLSHYWCIESKRRKLFYYLAVEIASIFNMKPDDIFYLKKSMK